MTSSDLKALLSGIFVFGILAIVIIFVHNPWPEYNSLNAYERAAQSAVRVEKLGERDSHGSGAVISPDGVVLTAAHVCNATKNDQGEVMLRRSDGEQVIGWVTWVTNADLDLCLVRPYPSDLSWAPVEIRDEPLRRGEEVFALGWPYARELTATRGIVSSLDGITNSKKFPRVQTDLVLLPGNSGGPLLDTEGRLVGINVQIAGAKVGFSYMIWNGASYSIPISYLRLAGIT